jgi:hypothetical protein
MSRLVLLKPGREVVVRHTACKPKQCHNCKQWIQPGEEYYDGSISVVRRRKSNGYEYLGEK